MNDLIKTEFSVDKYSVYRGSLGFNYPKIFEGWAKEPVTEYLKVPGEMIGQIFPHEDPSMSFALFDSDEPIATCSANNWNTYLKKLPENLETVSKDPQITTGTQTFIKLLSDVLSKEQIIKTNLENKGYDIDQVVHRCGLMVMPEYNGKGLATALARISTNEILQLGTKVIIVKTTNIKSRAVYEKLGYICVWDVSYDKYDMNVFSDSGETFDRYSILITIVRLPEPEQYDFIKEGL